MTKPKDPFMTGFKRGVTAGIIIGIVAIHFFFTWLAQRPIDSDVANSRTLQDDIGKQSRSIIR